MSACISREGEYGSHDLDPAGDHQFVCRRCFVLDEDAIFDAIAEAEWRVERGKDLAASWADSLPGDIDRHYAASRLREVLESLPEEVPDDATFEVEDFNPRTGHLHACGLAGPCRCEEDLAELARANPVGVLRAIREARA